jgi:hypothetical protein
MESAHKKEKRRTRNKKKKKYIMVYRTKVTNDNKLLIYKQILRAVWQYGTKLCGCSKPSNIIQIFQNKVLWGIVDAPWYVRNSDLHRDLNIESVSNIIKKMAQNHKRRLHNHPNTEAIQLLNYREATRDSTGPSRWNCVSARSDPS